jgi:DnaJ domain
VPAMYALVLGLSALLVGHFIYNGLKTANAAARARTLRVGTGGLALAGAALLASRGVFALAAPLAILGGWLVLGPNTLPLGSFPGHGQSPTGKTSRVLTDTLEMELDLDTGDMRGRILKGVFASRKIQSLAPAELAMLWRDCRFTDPTSAKLIEAYLDRVHPTWREDMARAEAEPGAGGILTRDLALEILGLKDGASEDDIRRAHRALIKKLHPDQGGSGYLASKINEAKDVLIGK